MTQEEFYKGFNDFISNKKEERIETGTPLDTILKNGMPKDKIIMLVGKSNIGGLMDQYVEHLINTKQN